MLLAQLVAPRAARAFSLLAIPGISEGDLDVSPAAIDAVHYSLNYSLINKWDLKLHLNAKQALHKVLGP